LSIFIYFLLFRFVENDCCLLNPTLEKESSSD